MIDFFRKQKLIFNDKLFTILIYELDQDFNFNDFKVYDFEKIGDKIKVNNSFIQLSLFEYFMKKEKLKLCDIKVYANMFNPDYILIKYSTNKVCIIANIT
jgi:hypothetical protein